MELKYIHHKQQQGPYPLSYSTHPHCVYPRCLQSKSADSSGGGNSGPPADTSDSNPQHVNSVPRDFHPPSGVSKHGAGGQKRATFEDSYQLGKELGHGSFSTVREGTCKVRSRMR